MVALCALSGWWMVHGSEKSQPRNASPLPEESVQTASPLPRRARSMIRRDEFRDGTTVEIFASKSPDEVILRFPSDETYGEFLAALTNGKVRLVDQLDRLRAIRLGYDEWADFAGLLEGENIIAYDSLPAVPAPGPTSGPAQAGLVGIEDGLLPWLGVTTDHSRWGAGVKIAVIDSGVVPHPSLPGLSQSIAITPFPDDPDKAYGHGTAVASLIAGNNPSAPGVAPAAELISIRVADEAGKADAFALAAGILAAVDSGAHIINISMGTRENNPLIEEAVLYARDHQALIVAASGNSGRADAMYPADYPSVISVGAVDARGEHLDFANYGTYLSLTAPGYAINAAWPGGGYQPISGTSASAPIVSGAIAATMSNGRGVTMSASQAAEIVMKHSNEAGIPGPDSEFGVGILDLGRVMRRGTPGIVDAAITNQRILKSVHPGGNDEIQVTVQNRGTVNLINTLVEIATPFGNRQFNATTITPGSIQTFSMSVRAGTLPQNEPVRISSSLALGNSGSDVTPANNWRSEMLYR